MTIDPIAARLAGACAVLSVLAAAPARAADAGLDRYPTNLTLLSEATEAALTEMFLDFTPEPGASVLVVSDARHEAEWFVQDLLLARLGRMGYEVHLRSASPPPAAPAPAAAAEEDDQAQAGPAVGPRQARRDSIAAAEAAAEAELDGEAPPPEDDTPSLSEALGMQSGGGTPADTAAAETPARPEPPPPVTDFVFRYRVVECGVTYPKSFRNSPLGSRRVQRMALANVHGTLIRGQRETVTWVGRGDAERGDVVPSGKLSVLEGGSYPFTKPTLETKGLGSFIEPALVTAIIAGLIYLFYANQD